MSSTVPLLWKARLEKSLKKLCEVTLAKKALALLVCYRSSASVFLFLVCVPDLQGSFGFECITMQAWSPLAALCQPVPVISGVNIWKADIDVKPMKETLISSFWKHVIIPISQIRECVCRKQNRLFNCVTVGSAGWKCWPFVTCFGDQRIWNTNCCQQLQKAFLCCTIQLAQTGRCLSTETAVKPVGDAQAALRGWWAVTGGHISYPDTCKNTRKWSWDLRRLVWPHLE